MYIPCSFKSRVYDPTHKITVVQASIQLNDQLYCMYTNLFRSQTHICNTTSVGIVTCALTQVLILIHSVCQLGLLPFSDSLNTIVKLELIHTIISTYIPQRVM